MENMKRAISAFMALVLVLGMMPGVPMFAGAEEVETLPEAVETTAAVTVPEETEAAETTEAPVETEVPETTAAEETVPETAAAETVPEETEAVEVEEELEASEEAVGGSVIQEKLVEKITVTASSTYTYLGDRVQISAKVEPADAEYPAVEYYVVEGGAHNAQVLAEKGVLIAEEAGTYVIAARAKDAGAHDSATQEKDGTVSVTFVEYGMEINRLDIADKNWFDADDDGQKETVRLMLGETLKLSVSYLIDGVVELPLGKANVKWTLREGDEKYVTLTPSADTKSVTVSVKASVTETKEIQLFAEDTAAGKDSITFLVYPIPYKVGIYNQEEEVTNKTIIVPILASSFTDPAFEYYTLDLTAQVWPLEADEPMVWTASDGKVEVKHPLVEGTGEEGVEPEYITTEATLRIYPYEGKTTITVTSKNYPDITSKITIERKWCLEQNDIRFSAETLRFAAAEKGLTAGKSFQLEVLDCRDADKLEVLDSSVVKWSLSAEDQSYATISAEGKLTAKKEITSGKEITVLCSVIGNEEAATLELPVIIRPLGTEVRIYAGNMGGDEAAPCIADEDVLNGKTVAVDTAKGCDPFSLLAVVMPNDECGASQEVTWSSSDKTIAAIDPDTDEIVWKGKNGTVTITATAKDGSGKKASVKLKFCVQVQGIEIIQNDPNFFLRSGSSWTFGVEFTTAEEGMKPTDKSVTWSLAGENDSKYASVSSSGKLTAKTVYEEHTVTLRATAKDGSGVYGELPVLIKPKKDGILTLMSGDEYVTKTTIVVSVGDSVTLDAYILGYADKENSKWTRSNSNGSIDSQYGESVTVTMDKVGSVTITAASVNDTSNKASVTIKAVRMTESIEWTHTHETTELACGKSLTLKAKAYAADEKTPTVSKLAWSVEEGGEKYVKVSGGKVTAIAGALSPYDAPVDVTIVVSATDGSDVSETWSLTIHPQAQTVLTFLTDDQVSELNVTGTTYTYVMETPGVDTLQASAQVWSENAIQGITWKSSNSKIASIDKESGEITCKKTGTVTITATSADGSGKKATFKLTIVLRPTGLYFDMSYAVAAGGKDLKLKPILLDGNGNKVTGKKLEWDILPYPGENDDDTGFVKSITGGVLKTKKVTEPKHFLISVKTVEKYEDWESPTFLMLFEIFPATGSVQITHNGKDAGKEMAFMLSSGGVQLGGVAESKTGDMPFQHFVWKSSNKSIAEVDPYTGEVTFKKAGTVTITATAADGTGISDSVKITVKK